MEYPEGLFKTRGSNRAIGWGYHCPKCRHTTLSTGLWKRGEILRIWHCGAWHELKPPRFPKTLLLPVVDLRGPVLILDTGGTGEFLYQQD